MIFIIFGEEMRKKKILILCSCNFTKIGIETLIRDSQLSARVELVANTDSVECGKNLVSNSQSLDIVIVILVNVNISLFSHLEMMCNILLHNYKLSKVVLIGECAIIDLFKGNFNGLYKISVATEIKNLEKNLINIIISDTNYTVKSDSTALTVREFLILRKLLNGHTQDQLADDLKISKKTVSSHKCTALAKLGIRSLSPLILPMSESVIYKKSKYRQGQS